MYCVSLPSNTAYYPRSSLLTPAFQAALRLASAQQGTVECLCNGRSGAFVFPREGVNGNLHLVRRHDTMHLHRNGCVHHPVLNMCAEYGVPDGSVSHRGDNLLINFNRLFRDEQVERGDGQGGVRQSQLIRRSPLYALGWLLIDRAGLNVSIPQMPVNPWRELDHGTRSIHVRSGTEVGRLADLLVLPVGAHDRQFARNFARMQEAASKRLDVVVIASLPRGQANQVRVDLWPQVRTKVGLSTSVISRAFKRFWNADAHWKRGGEVMVIGTAKPTFHDDKPGIELKRIALIPVTKSLMPLPLPAFEEGYSRACDVGHSYAVWPELDPILRG